MVRSSPRLAKDVDENEEAVYSKAAGARGSAGALMLHLASGGFCAAFD